MPTLNKLLTAHPYRDLQSDPAYISPSDFYNETDGVYVVAKNCSAIEEALRENAQPAIVFRLNGYAGCGKTMFAHFLIRKYGGDEQFYYEFDEKEGKNYNLNYVIMRITRRLSYEIAKLYKKQTAVIQRFETLGRQFYCSEPVYFGLQDLFLPGRKGNKELKKVKPMLSADLPRITEQIRTAITISVNSVKANAIPPDGSQFDAETYKRISSLSFLLILDFLLRHALTCFSGTEQAIVFCLLDNLDNLKRDAIADLYCSILDVSEKIMDFYRNSHDEENYFSTYFRLVYLVPTRAVTYRKLRDEVLLKRPSGIWEQIDSTFCIELSLNSALHGRIIEKRLEYWENKGMFSGDQKKQIERIEELIQTQFSSGSFSALFNNNYAHCVRLILDFFEKKNGWGNLSENFLCNLSTECIASSDTKSIPDSKYYVKSSAGVAQKGIFLRVMLEILKENNAYASPYDQNRKDHFRVSSKLGLVPLDSSTRSHPYGVSLSRLILTYLRSKENRIAHLNELFDCFFAYDPEDICRCVYALSENIRDVWRRLIMFNRTIPSDIEDLYKQARAYKNKTSGGTADREGGSKEIKFTDIDYTEIELCSAGEEYLMVITPSFEFFLSRLDQQRNNLEGYPPLFFSNSIRSGNEKWKSSINAVLQSVKKCAEQLYDYDTNMVESLLKQGKEEAIQHLFVASRKDESVKQTHLSRILFSHISYLDHFRVYYLWYWRKIDREGKTKSYEQLVADNEFIVSYIIRYLTLFNKSWIQNNEYTSLFENQYLEADEMKQLEIFTDSYSIYNYLEHIDFPLSLSVKNGFQNQQKAYEKLLDQVLTIHNLGYAQDTFEIPITTD